MLSKTYTDTTCIVKFTLKPEEALGSKTIAVAGDFNNWKTDQYLLTEKEDGSFEGQVELPRNSAFEFRYLRDNALWQIETQADKYVYNKFADGENSVVITK